ncbi:hypothetical protein HK096_002508 [Nowakowskiella sp. JEL0078]|nr:hypothetical protein HK096_002508 [Nowakowskiella sp. JEL0078]
MHAYIEIGREKCPHCQKDKMKTEFTEEQQRWYYRYVANLYMYLKYHPTNDYPVNLEDVWKLLGFANKGNAKRNLENNFVMGDDYKEVGVRHVENLLLTTEKQLHGGHNKETIMLNIETKHELPFRN